MGNQAAVYSIQALKDFQAALVMFSEDALGALGAVDMEARRTLVWLQQDRRPFWIDQIKKRREWVAQAKAEVFRRQLAKTADYTPSFSEQKEALRKAEESLKDAESRLTLVKKWEQILPQIIFEYQGSARRIKDMAAGDALRAALTLAKIVDALESYIREAPSLGSSPSGQSPMTSIANSILDEAKKEEESEEAGDEKPAAAAASAEPAAAPTESPS